MKNHHFLVIYDIRNDKRLKKVAKVMEQYGLRVQKSVFEMDCSEKILNELRKKVSKLIEEEDYVVYFKICEKDWQKREKYGKMIYEEDNKDFEIL